MTGLTDPERIRLTLTPRLVDGEVVCLCWSSEQPVPADALGTLQEEEGLTVLLPRMTADQMGLDYHTPLRRIVLGVHSSLEAVGLTAAVSRELARIDCPANIWAGYYHDHVLVPAPLAEAALAALQRWQDR